jgi:hypothetical protein
MTEIDPQDFGELRANVKTLTAEIHLLRKDMQQVNAMLNQGKGGLYVMLLAAGAIGSVFTVMIRKMFGG